MIGNDKKGLEELLENPTLREGILPSKILYQYPALKISENSDPISHIIHDFAFPFGVDTVQI